MKEFKSITEQIELLKSRNLTFLDEENAEKLLLQYGYYEIINGYKDHLLQDTDANDNSDIFKDGETFEHLYSLYDFDKLISTYVLQALLELELTLKTAISYTVANHYGVLESDYLKRTNYVSRDSYFKNGSRRYKLDDLLLKFNYILNDTSQPFKHYRENNGHIPPWILLKGASFGNTLKYFKYQKGQVKSEIVSILTGIPIEIVNSTDSVKNAISDLLTLSNKFRNRTAHSGRLFNYRSEKKVRYNTLFHPIINVDNKAYRLGIGQSDVFTLINLLKLLENDTPFYRMAAGIQVTMKRHLKEYPDDQEFLLKSMGFPKELRVFEIDDLFYRLTEFELTYNW